jgi:SAM-dependent methyltransferase
MNEVCGQREMNATALMTKSPSESTIAYYDIHANEYCALTRQIDLREFYTRFLHELPVHAHILDAGCGSGRDTKAFLDLGHRVTAIDASAALAKLAAEYTNQECGIVRFQQIDLEEQFDGIWACASLLHVPGTEMNNVLSRFIRALKPRGVLYMSLKEGEGERFADDGRFFCDYTRDSLEQLTANFPSLDEIAFWRTEEIRSSGNHQPWLSFLFRKIKSQ